VNATERARLADDLLRRLAAAIRGAQLYAPGHPLVTRSVTSLLETLATAHQYMPSVTIGIVGEDLVVGDIPIRDAASTMGELMRRVQQAGIERIVIDRGVQSDEIVRLVETVSRSESGDQTAALSRLPHIRVGRLQVDEQTDAGVGDIATFRKLYDDAVKVAETLWESAGVEGIPDADAARGMVDSLAQAVAQNRTALLALTALKNYDNYTFTHMVNVSILTMGQARGVGIDGPLLREFGLAALMHDIGKVKTPNEILNKPDKLTEQEYEILKKHTVDGAQILRKTPEMPTLAPVVAFEHHLRADGTGYPSAQRAQLNLATTLCGIADVYDAMRSQRVYQPAVPTDRILAVLQRNDGKQFDQNLVRRFVQLVGIYPVGNMVRLYNGEIRRRDESPCPRPYRPSRAHPDDGRRDAAGESDRSQPVGDGGRAGQRDPGAARSRGIWHRSAVTALSVPSCKIQPSCDSSPSWRVPVCSWWHSHSMVPRCAPLIHRALSSRSSSINCAPIISRYSTSIGATGSAHCSIRAWCSRTRATRISSRSRARVTPRSAPARSRIATG
jgi:putative nucleotidyltransferase with HDIG domain